MNAKLPRILSILVAGALIAGGCGGDDDGGEDTGAEAPAQTETQTEPAPAPEDEASGGGGGSELQIAADAGGQLRFDQESLEAEAGTVTIVMDNPSTVPHAVGIKNGGLDEVGEVVGQGEKSTATADLQAGDYTFYCPVDGHEQAGMTGTLTVK